MTTRLRQAIPTALTLGNLGFGFATIWLCLTQQDKFWQDSRGLFTSLGLLLMSSCLCDFLDGFVARKLKVTTPLGIELDSLADLVSFGVAPVVIFYLALFDAEPSPLAFIACLIYLLSGAFRLARFNNKAHADTAKPTGYFDGLPITGASALWVAVLLFFGQKSGNNMLYFHEDTARLAISALFAVLGLLMISHVPYKSLKKAPGNKVLAQRIALLGTFLALALADKVGFGAVLTILAMSYIFGSPAAAVLSKAIKKRKSEPAR